MFEHNSMLSFRNLNQFIEFYDSLLVRMEWKISSENIRTRGEKIYSKHYTNKLRDLFSEKQLFRRNVSISEIVSWLDSFQIIIRVIKILKIYLLEEEFSKLHLHVEYKIYMSKNRRVDYVFAYDNRLLLVEFRLSEKFPSISNIWQKKEQELIIYKELMYNYINTNHKILIYAFIAMPEYNVKLVIPKGIKYNSENILHFSQYLCMFLVNKQAIE